MKTGRGISSSCKCTGRRELFIPLPPPAAPAQQITVHSSCTQKGWQQQELIPHPLLLLLNCSECGLDPEPSSALPGEFGQQAAFCLLIREAPNRGRGVWHQFGLQTWPWWKLLRSQQHRRWAQAVDNSNEGDSALQSQAVLQAARPCSGWSTNTCPPPQPHNNPGWAQSRICTTQIVSLGSSHLEGKAAGDRSL